MSRARAKVSSHLPLVSPKSAERVCTGWSRGQRQRLAQRLEIYPRSCQLRARRRHLVPDNPRRREPQGAAARRQEPRDRRQPRVPGVRGDGTPARAAARGIHGLDASRRRAPRPVPTRPALRLDLLRPAREPLIGGRWLRRAVLIGGNRMLEAQVQAAEDAARAAGLGIGRSC